MSSFARSIAWRFMMKGTERGTLSPMTIFAWLAIGVGVAAMSSLLAVMYGFESSLKDKVLKAYPHVIVRPKAGGNVLRDYAPITEAIGKTAGVQRVTPYLDSEMILQSERRTMGGVVWGIPLADLDKYQGGVSEGKLPDPKAKLPQVLLGMELGHALGAEVGSEIKIISPIERGGAMGMLPQAQTFQVAGLYASGHYEFDHQYLMMILEDAQDLLRTGNSISGWHVWADSLGDADAVAKRIGPSLPPKWEAASWTVFNSALFHSLALEQYAMFSILSFAIAIAVMNIVITLMMHVTHKKKNIGILRALGASTRQVRRVFIWQGALLGGVGLVLGAVLTVVFIVYVRYFSTYQLPDIYYDRSIPIEIRPLSLLLIYGVAILMIFLATLYPSARAARLDPVDAIRE